MDDCSALRRQRKIVVAFSSLIIELSALVNAGYNHSHKSPASMAGEQLVLFALGALGAFDDETCTNISKIAHLTAIDRKVVRRCLSALIRHGQVVKHSRREMYCLHLDGPNAFNWDLLIKTIERFFDKLKKIREP